MPGIDEELGRYLDSLVEPVEPEWVIGWVARRRRRRAALVAVGGVVLAGAAGSLGYALHSPGPSGSVRFGTEVSSSSTDTSSTSEPTSSTTVSVPTTRPHTSGSATTAPGLPVYPWPLKALAAGDVRVTLQFATTSLVSGVPVEVTVTLENQTDDGVVIRDFPSEDLVVVIADQLYQCNPVLYPALANDTRAILPPRATANGSCQYTPGDPGTASAHVDLAFDAAPLSAPFIQTPVDLDIAPPETTTTSSPPETTTTTG